MIILMFICVACSNSPVDEDERKKGTHDLEEVLKDMVLIPADEFLMGSPEGEGAFDEYPQHIVYLDDYYIDKYEVTNAQFKEFVEATGYVTDVERIGRARVWNPKETYANIYYLVFEDVNWRYPNAWRYNRPHPKVWENHITDTGSCYLSMYLDINHPVVQVSWNDAQAYCQWAGKRLPTEAEWEKAAKGTDGRKYPWGNEFNLDIEGAIVHANIASDGLVPVDSFSTGVSPFGAYNMAGNVQEWVADWYAPDYYARSLMNNPKGPDSGVARVLRGGSWRDQKSYQVLSAARAYQVPDYSSNFVGFRCAWSR